MMSRTQARTRPVEAILSVTFTRSTEPCSKINDYPLRDNNVCIMLIRRFCVYGNCYGDVIAIQRKMCRTTQNLVAIYVSGEIVLRFDPYIVCDSAAINFRRRGCFQSSNNESFTNLQSL